MSKPIKRHPALVTFSREHHFGLLLCWKIRQGIQKNIASDRMIQYALAFNETELCHHFAMEEQQLFTLLTADDNLRIQAEGEHFTIQELFTALNPSDPDYSALSRLADSLEQHIRFEERTLFPYIEKHAHFKAYADAMDLHTAHTVCSIDDQWSDPFWLRDVK